MTTVTIWTMEGEQANVRNVTQVEVVKSSGTFREGLTATVYVQGNEKPLVFTEVFKVDVL